MKVDIAGFPGRLDMGWERNKGDKKDSLQLRNLKKQTNKNSLNCFHTEQAIFL